MTVALVLISMVNQAQNFKIKGGKIVIDDQAIALIDNKKALYTISSLEKTSKMTVEVKQIVYDNGELDRWYEITDVATLKKNRDSLCSITKWVFVWFRKKSGCQSYRGSTPIVVGKRY